MADVRKEQERDELHRAIWAIADELRGSVDGWDFKSYVLGMMFYRYISENLTNYINEGEIEAGNDGFGKFDIAHEDTLLNPQHWDDEPFEVIVSNPPYSIKWEGDDNPVLINDPASLLPECLHRSQKLTLRLSCIPWRGLPPMELRRSFASPALCTVAELRRKSVSI